MVLAFTCALVLAAGSPAEGPRVPWFVPRSAMVGVLVNPPVASPMVRLGWEGAIVTQPRNELSWIVNLGSALGLSPPQGMRELYQHVAVAGIGYRYDHNRLHWGLSLGGGVLWYRAAYVPGSFYRFESFVVGYAEGRAQLGVRLGPHLVLAAFAGYASPFVVRTIYPGSLYVGGFNGGVLVNWK